MFKIIPENQILTQILKL